MRVGGKLLEALRRTIALHCMAFVSNFVLHHRCHLGIYESEISERMRKGDVVIGDVKYRNTEFFLVRVPMMFDDSKDYNERTVCL
jgi:hypothetical protein